MELLSPLPKIVFSIGSVFLYSLGWLIAMLSLSDHQWNLLFFGYILFVFCPFIYFEARICPIKSAVDLLLILWSCSVGLLVELALIHTKVITYIGASWLPPFNILILYPLFAVLITHSLGWLKQRLWLACILGFFGGPLIYMQGVYLGAALFTPSWSSYLLLATIWGVLFPFLIFLSNRFENKIHILLKEAQNEPLVLLVDLKCPLCSREVAHLEKYNGYYNAKRIEFIDLNSHDYVAENYQNITVEKGMQKIHAITSQGDVLTGIEAFIPVYARTGHLFLALLYSQPVSRTLCHFAYQIFARNRKLMLG